MLRVKLMEFYLKETPNNNNNNNNDDVNKKGLKKF